MHSYIVHVNRQFIAKSVKTGADLPYYTVKDAKGKAIYARGINFHESGVLALNTLEFIQGEPLKCGARAYVKITTSLPIEGYMIDPMTYAEAKALYDAA